MKLPRSRAGLWAIAASVLGISASCGEPAPSASNDICRKDSDCPEDLICGQENKCINAGKEMLVYQQQISSEDGAATITLPDARLNFTLAQQDGKPLAGINVHYVGNEKGEIILAVDPHRRYQPEVLERRLDSTTASLSSSAVQQALRTGQQTILFDPIEEGKKVYALLASDEREFLGRLGPVNRYCMTLEQLLHSEIEIPAGLVLLVPEAAGYDTDRLKVAVTTPLREIFSQWVLRKHGMQDKYEIRVPRTAVNVCGEYDLNAVCDLSTDELSRRVWNPRGMPYWEIRGGCSSGSSTPGVPPRGDLIKIVSLSPPLTCIQFDKEYAVDVAVEYAHRPFSPRNSGHIRLQLSSDGCPILNTTPATASSGRVTIHGSFTPQECYDREPLVYTLTAMLCESDGTGCQSRGQDQRSVPKCD